MKYKNYEIPDKEIDSLMDKLDISIAEACEMYLCDKEILTDDTVEELTQKASKNRITQTIHSAKGDKKVKKTREKKENPLKKEIISVIFQNLCEKYPENTSFLVKNAEKYIDFTIDGREFTLNLVEHRPKKKKE